MNLRGKEFLRVGLVSGLALVGTRNLPTFDAHAGRSPNRMITPATPVAGMDQEGNKYYDWALQQGNQTSLDSVAFYPDTQYIPSSLSVAVDIGFSDEQQYVGSVGEYADQDAGIVSANVYRHTGDDGTITIHPTINLDPGDKGKICIGSGESIQETFTDMNCWGFENRADGLVFSASDPETFDPHTITYRDKPAGPVEQKDVFSQRSLPSPTEVSTPVGTP